MQQCIDEDEGQYDAQSEVLAPNHWHKLYKHLGLYLGPWTQRSKQSFGGLGIIHRAKNRAVFVVVDITSE